MGFRSDRRERPVLLRRRLTADGSEKMARFVDLCDTFHLPCVNFLDQPGFVIGTWGEKAATIRKGARAMTAVFQATVPWVTIVVRRAYGVAGAAHANTGEAEPPLRLAERRLGEPSARRRHRSGLQARPRELARPRRPARRIGGTLGAVRARRFAPPTPSASST